MGSITYRRDRVAQTIDKEKKKKGRIKKSIEPKRGRGEKRIRILKEERHLKATGNEKTIQKKMENVSSFFVELPLLKEVGNPGLIFEGTMEANTEEHG